MPAVGDLVGPRRRRALRPRVDEVAAFLNGLLLPHMEAAEHTLYPELERMLQNRHSMTPMRREHDEIRHSSPNLSASGERLTRRVCRNGRDGCTAPRDLPSLRDAEGAPRRGAAVPRDHRARRLAEGAERLAAAMEHSGITAF